MSKPRTKAGQAAWIANRRAKEYGREEKVLPRDVSDRWHSDQYTCVVCKTKFAPDSGQLTLEHIVPLAEGGTNDASNISTSCYSCNSQGGKTGNQRVKAATYDRAVDKMATQIAKAELLPGPLVRTAEEAGISRAVVYKYRQSPELNALVQRKVAELEKKERGLTKVSQAGLSKVINLLESHIDTLQATGELSPGQIDDLVRIAGVLGGALKVAGELGLEDKTDEITKEDRMEAKSLLRRSFVRGLRYGLKNPGKAEVLVRCFSEPPAEVGTNQL